MADDHAVMRSGVCNALQDLPDLETIGEVRDGPSLLVDLDRLRPDLLLIDVTMLDSEPVSTIRQIRARYAHRWLQLEHPKVLRLLHQAAATVPQTIQACSE